MRLLDRWGRTPRGHAGWGLPGLAVMGLGVMALGPLAGCSAGALEPDPRAAGLDGIVLLTLDEPQEAWMSALYRGDVVVDEAGCLRLAGPDAPTVIWPEGYHLAPTIEGPEVRDASGHYVGRVNDHFTLGGGEVPYLHSGIPMSDADRRWAREQCPGRYWIGYDAS